ncbi:MAG: hypothetical protein GY832_22285 [Chloroflexi bacterium]|nr:hypothetical protein [Chloroflexota bacterium]
MERWKRAARWCGYLVDDYGFHVLGVGVVSALMCVAISIGIDENKKVIVVKYEGGGVSAVYKVVHGSVYQEACGSNWIIKDYRGDKTSLTGHLDIIRVGSDNEHEWKKWHRYRDYEQVETYQELWGNKRQHDSVP